MSNNSRLILEIINKSNEHLTAEQIFFKLKKKSPKTVLATVYNNLNSLYRDGLIRKISVSGQPDLYDKTTRHDHLICQKCGHLSDFTFEDLTAQLSEQLADSIISYDLKVVYICQDCRQNLKNREI